jgi:spectinomycin phosphotransferase
MFACRETAVDAQTAASLVLDHFGVRVVGMEAVEGGLDPSAALWRATDSAGDEWTIKVTRRDVRFGLLVADAVAGGNTPGIAVPRRGPDGLPWVEHNGSILSMAPWIPGLDATDSATSPSHWEEFGRTLRRVHDHRMPAAARPGRRGIRRTGKSPRKLLAEIDLLFSGRFPSGEAPDGDAGGGSAADDWEALWLANRHRVVSLVRLERRLKGRRGATERVPVHGDPHIGNLIIDEAGQSWLIDFDEASIAPREVDLMLVELGVIFSAPITDVQRRSFRAGYGDDFVIDEDRILRFGCVRAVEDIAATVRLLVDADPVSRGVPGGVGRAEAAGTLASLFGPAGLMALVEERA